MKLQSAKRFLSLINIILLTGCEHILIENPSSNISSVNFYKNEADALSGLYGAYSQLYNIYNNSYIEYGELNADNLKGSYVNTGNIFDMFSISNESTASFWQNSFSGVNLANEVIYYTDRIKAPADKKAIIIAEARALRAIYYFNLVRAMGGVPIYKTPTLGFENINNPRSTQEEVYTLIVEDLKNAENVLPRSSIAGRINSNIATALLARIYLFRSDFKNAFASAKRIIDSGKYKLFNDYTDAFKPDKKNGIEHIFQIQYLSGEQNSGIPGAFGPRSPAGPYNGTFWAKTSVSGNYEPEQSFVNENPKSYRKSVTIANSYLDINGTGKVITMNEVYKGKFPYYISKFDDRASELQSGENFNVIRYADILLIAAESINEIDPQNADKYKWINQIRERARNGIKDDLPDLANLSQDEFRTAVLSERRFELAFEGERAWDLKRRGLFLKTMRAQGAIIEDYMLLFPIPNTQIILNPNLIQNPGW
ncbi:RagB/SusD family nutrient uptake outer membrane protein [Spirosoma aureum]|uniref:RagB/SusD family nutrient uptake outer membrane protein n=1 Tax=Spirosoma aureum TaxID=2692134 RepID=A0A6G9ARR1_9BACT|nr:RagB/SusD family nutrient uptake outer membrane protein [Spirosoma aureum]QIP15068.1 RagB/SusD family nutrient uptake outer membrane protein [Spirosoma aureum]